MDSSVPINKRFKMVTQSLQPPTSPPEVNMGHESHDLSMVMGRGRITTGTIEEWGEGREIEEGGSVEADAGVYKDVHYWSGSKLSTPYALFRGPS